MHNAHVHTNVTSIFSASRVMWNFARLAWHECRYLCELQGDYTELMVTEQRLQNFLLY